MEARILHIVQCVLMALSLIFQIVLMSGSTAMWSSDGTSLDGAVSVNGCGLFKCDGPPACGCVSTMCGPKCPMRVGTCPDLAQEADCSDLAGHMSAAQAFVLLTLFGMIPAMVLCVVRLTPFAEKIPSMLNVQCIHIFCAVLCLVSFALVAASYDMDLCDGCVVKDVYDSSLSYGFAFLVINTVFQIICAILAGASQAMEGSGGGDYASYSS